jgi:hypothetical protein
MFMNPGRCLDGEYCTHSSSYCGEQLSHGSLDPAAYEQLLTLDGFFGASVPVLPLTPALEQPDLRVSDIRASCRDLRQ